MSNKIVRKRKLLTHRGRHRKVRPQTFSTEVQAKAYAQKHGMKSFDVVKINIGLSNKFKVVGK